MSHIQFRNPNDAFDSAVRAGVLSDCAHTPNYAGRYMYMHTAYGEGPCGEPVDYFKHIETRRYVSACAQ